MATRDITEVLSNALDDEQIFPFFAVEMFFDSGPLRFWTGLGDATIDGDTYIGTGDLLDISSVTETTEVAARGATLVLTGITSGNLDKAFNSPYQGRICNISFGVVNGSVYSGLTQVFSGYMDEMNIEEGPESSTIELKIENKLIDLERQRVRRYNSSHQNVLYPTDRGFDFVESIAGQKIMWGKK